MPGPSPAPIADIFAALASSELGIVCATVDGRFLDDNPSFSTMLGYTREDLLGRNFAEISHPDDVRGNVNGVQRFASGAASSYSTQKRYVHKNGGVVWVILHAVLVKRTAGDANGLLVLVENDMERKHAEQALRASQERLALATRASGVGVWDWNIESRALFWDDSMFQLYGIRCDDFAGAYEAWSSCVLPADRARTEAEVQASLRDRRPYDAEFRIVKADGEIRHIKAHAELLCDDAGRVQRLIGTHCDITERKRTEDALLESHERLQLALEASHTGTWRVDLITGMDTRDASLNRMVGLPAVPSTQPVNDWFAYLHPDDMAAIQSAWERGIESGVYEVEHRIIRRDGKVLWVQDRGIVVRDVTGQPIYAIGAAMDITERKESENKIRFLSRIYATLSQTNQAVIECAHEPALFDRVCRIVGESGGMKMAWIGKPDEASDLIKPVACYGSGTEYLDDIVISRRGELHEGNGHAGLSYREACAVEVGDFGSDTRTVHYRERARLHGWAASATFPIFLRGQVYALLSLYHTEKEPFTQEIIDLMKQMAVNIGHGLHRFELETERRETALALEESAKRYHDVLHTSLDGYLTCDIEGRLYDVNDAYLRKSGYTHAELLKMRLADLEAQMDAASVAEQLRRFMYVGHARLETRHRAKDGTVWPLEISLVFLPQSGGRFFCFMRDITERKRAEESMRLAASIYRSSTEALMVTDENNRIIDVNPAFTRITGYERAAVLGMDGAWLQSAQHDKALHQEMWRSIQRKGRWQGEKWDRRQDGELNAKWVNVSVIRRADGGIHRRITQFSDITEKKRKDELILTQANYDPLTGLPNRRLSQDRLEMEIRKAHRGDTRVALLLIDLDRFKEINDTLGHAKGDVLLVEAGRRISTCAREADTVARLGGDEFTVILSEFTEPAQVERVAQDIIRELSEPFSLDENDIGYISATVGITVYPDDATEIVDLLKHADQAMYRAKGEGRSRFSYFTPSMQREAQEKRALTDDLRYALPKGELHLYYQPIVSMGTRQIVKAEALLRWQHPQRGMIGPATFIPLAEESRMIVDIGNWVFREACAGVERWRRQFGRVIQVSVNKSPVQFEHRAKTEWLESLTRSGLPGNSITIELTEGLLLKDSPKVKERLLEFRNSGVEVSIDDFGTGFSSLSYLKQFDIDYLKIDRSFMRFLTENESDKALVEAIIVMAHKLDLQAVAEGVETEEQHELLASFGCDYAQGFLYSPAVPEEAFVRLLGQ